MSRFRAATVDRAQTSNPPGAEAPGANRYGLLEVWRDLRREFRNCGGTRRRHIAPLLLFGRRFQLLVIYRLARFAAHNRTQAMRMPLMWIQAAQTGCELSPNSELGNRIRLPHPTGIVIGAGVVGEDEVCLFQQVTLGSYGHLGNETHYPIVRRRARIYAGAKVIGGITIGEGAVVAANAIVTQDAPAGATAVGIPARILALGVPR